ncbi:uncharacterized protein LOC102801515 [Saccoglossus kowalevskii]|uniref:Uncharacterized protein LOC102801515 n=1 Tax=Saccoglossus kowalevskii TaxID=10224 RepID=A0ABM0MYJ6_SACKO|nr:PREDICTED: uncharacterized protein LOC102801515 [Saccoglossus kowalevskii]
MSQDDNTQLFPFQKLPADCQVYIFSHLNSIEKAKIATVCKSWNDLLRTPRLWNCVDFHILTSCDCTIYIGIGNRRPVNTCEKCKSLSHYVDFKQRCYRYIAHLAERRAVIKSLKFQFDLHEDKNVWLKLLVYALNMTTVNELSIVDCNWTVTGEKPSSLYVTDDFMEKKKEQRVEALQGFLLVLNKHSPNINTLRLEFDWSETSLELLSSFKEIKCLELYRFWVYKSIPQERINFLLNNAKKLESLKLEIWVPYQHEELHPQFSLMSSTLQYLDVSSSKGFFIRSLNMPQLKTLIIVRLPWIGPLLPVSMLDITCVYDVLREGAPKLEQINQHKLCSDWKNLCYPELESQLNHTCYCTKHKKGWAL